MLILESDVMRSRSHRYAKSAVLLAAMVSWSYSTWAQNDPGEIHGSLNLDAQYYQEDSAIGANVPPEQIGINAWSQILYTKGKFQAGIRFESYEPSLLGYPAGQPYSGTGIGYRFVSYTVEKLEVTVGNFFEQYGSGMAFRAYEERGLGVDNAMDGVRLRYNAGKGLYLKGAVGRQRFGFEDGFTKGSGIVRAFDAELSMNELFPSMADNGKNITIAGSFVSKFQEDKDPLLVLPENVGLWAGRARFTNSKWNIFAEYAHKINDPNSQNDFIYKDGQGMIVQANYSVRGFAFGLGAHTYDNMSFQSDRAAPTGFDLNVNFLPPLTLPHTYNLPATLYPYATQPNGEVGYQGDLVYKFKKKSKYGGKYGTTFALNYSVVFNLDSTAIQNDENLEGYETNFFTPGEQMYFQDFNVKMIKKFKNRSELVLTYINMVYDIDVIQGKPGQPVIFADYAIIDYSIPLKNRHNLRIELQHLWTKQDKGNWITGVAEYTISPHWFFSFQNQYNYGKTDIHYPFAAAGYTKGGNRFQLSYGRQRAGIFCVGGVCRQVPAANGLTLSITSTF